jgi:hypothetical protein
VKPGSWLRRRPPLAETAADFGPLARPLDQDDDTWDCPHCGESNFADGHKQCWRCLLAAPWVDPADDPSYCCEACENLTARIRRARQAVLITQFLLPDLERELVELEAKHRDDLAQEMADLERRHQEARTR